ALPVELLRRSGVLVDGPDAIERDPVDDRRRRRVDQDVRVHPDDPLVALRERLAEDQALLPGRGAPPRAIRAVERPVDADHVVAVTRCVGLPVVPAVGLPERAVPRAHRERDDRGPVHGTASERIAAATRAGSVPTSRRRHGTARTTRASRAIAWLSAPRSWTSVLGASAASAAAGLAGATLVSRRPVIRGIA